MRSRIVALAATALVAGLGLLWAQAAATPAAPPQPATAKAGCPCGAEMGSPAAGAMMDECKAMMVKHQAMTDEMKAMDARLDALVKAMNESRGSEKADATAAVVTELVAQRKAARQAMSSMQATMMQHMPTAAKGASGACCGQMMEGAKTAAACCCPTMEGAKAGSAPCCPMMEGAKTEAGGHAMHP